MNKIKSRYRRDIIHVDYYAKISKKKHSRQIIYDFRSFKSDNFLMVKDPKQYCRKQVVKMCFYVSKLYGYEIMRMKCSFLVDDEGIIWFHNVDKILTRVKHDHIEDKLPNGVTY